MRALDVPPRTAAAPVAAARFQFDALTSLRGVAALLTVFIHLAAVWASVFPSMQGWRAFQHFAAHTYLFVDFFFILSGFVMSHAYARYFSAGVTLAKFTRFMRARFARVYPLHIVLLAVYVALASMGLKQEVDNPDGSILANALLVQALGFFDHPTWNGPSWSISVEWWTYVLFPFAAAFAQRFVQAGRMALLGLALSVAGYGLLTLHVGHANITVGLSLLRCVLGFSAGAHLYVLFLARRADPPANLVATAVLLAVVAGLTLAPSPAVDIGAFLCFCVLVYATSKRAHERQWLHHPALIRLGDMSYSIYLWHTLVLHLVAKMALAVKAHHGWEADQDGLYFALTLLVFEAAILSTAYLSHRFIEVPARDLLNGRKRAPGKVVLTPTPP